MIIEGIDQVISTSRIETDLVDVAETVPIDKNKAVFETTTAGDVPSVGLIEAKEEEEEKEDQLGIEPIEEEGEKPGIEPISDEEERKGVLDGVAEWRSQMA